MAALKRTIHQLDGTRMLFCLNSAYQSVSVRLRVDYKPCHGYKSVNLTASLSTSGPDRVVLLLSVVICGVASFSPPQELPAVSAGDSADDGESQNGQL